MELLFDMIHHNPGEAPMDSAFRDPLHLKAFGYLGQAFKHINTVATFAAVAPGVFPATPEEADWLRKLRAQIRGEIDAAKSAGLQVFYHIDLFVLPARIIDHFSDRLLDPATGRISMDRPFTLELHRALFDEILHDFPEVDGLIIRVGETYLFDTPFHRGNGAVHYCPENSADNKIRQFIKLLRFLREEICVKHGKILIHRTWDTWPNRFHASPEFYLRVTDEIEPHPLLFFSIKHTVVDFHRWVEFNPCLTQGKHRQVVEVQCQREYEGKGAYPHYSTHGVIEGFPEQRGRKGLKDIVHHPLIAGLYTWSRGGGWYGPHVTRKNELWCELNAFVVARWAADPSRGEEAVFWEYARDLLGMAGADAAIFRRIALMSLDAVRMGKCCAVYDRRDKPLPGYPTNQWMRDDVLHGLDRLGPVFNFLREAGGIGEALAEKAESVALWNDMRMLCDEFSDAVDRELHAVITGSVEYGLRLFSAVEAAWRALICGWRMEPDLSDAIAAYDRAWAAYERLPQEYPACASLFRPEGWAWPGQDPAPGLKDSIDRLRDKG